MERYPEESLAHLEASLKEAEMDPDAIRRYDLCVDLANACITELEAYVHSNPFSGRKEEAIFFREQAPEAYSRLFYFMKLRELEIYRSYIGQDKFRGLLELELQKIENFKSRHADIYRCYYQKTPIWDDYLFARAAKGEWSGEEVGTYIENDFTLGSYWISWIKANEGLQVWVDKTIAGLELETTPANVSRTRLRFTGSKRDAVELGRALHLLRCFNNGNITQKEVYEALEADWGIDLGDYDVALQGISSRKISRTKFTDQLRAALTENMDGML